MKLLDVVEACNQRIPHSKTWRGMRGESYGPYLNGSSNKEIWRVLFSVTQSQAIERYAQQMHYDLTISHHPSRGEALPHLVYHTALDCCEGGLNDMWADAIGMSCHGTFDENLGAMGKVEAIAFKDLVAKCLGFAGDIRGFVTPGKDADMVRRVVICTGLGGMVLRDVERFKPDVYITGQLYGNPYDSSIPHIIEVGHTLSERCGVKVFQDLLVPHDVVVDSAPLRMDVFGSECVGQVADYRKTLGPSVWGPAGETVRIAEGIVNQSQGEQV